MSYLENLNRDLAESLKRYATPRTHPLVRGRTCQKAKLPKLQTFESHVDLGLHVFVAGILPHTSTLLSCVIRARTMY